MINTFLAGRRVVQVVSLGLCLLFLSSLANALDAPNNLRGTATDGSTIEWAWDWVPGAAQYEVTVDGLYVGHTRDPRYTSYGLWQGDHSLSVKAIDYNWNTSVQSETAKVFLGDSVSSNTPAVINTPAPIANTTERTSGGFNPPTNPRGTENGQGSVLWQWDNVSEASQYEVTIDGVMMQITSNLEYTSTNLWPGDHSMTVKAIAGGNVSGQSATAKIVTSEWFDVNTPARSQTIGESSSQPQNDGANNPAPPPPEPQAAVNDTGLIDPLSWSKPEVLSLSDWELTFSDEFDGNQLNPARWNGQLRWDGEYNGERYEYRIINGENQMYVNPISEDSAHIDLMVPQHNPFEFNGSTMSIRAIRNPLFEGDFGIDHGPLRDVARQQEFLSGAISSYDKFSQKHGRFEARIKIPGHVGTFPAFWLYHQKRKWEGTQRTEIDIMENLGHAPQFIYNSFHYHTDVSETYSGNANFLKPQPSGQIHTGTNYSEDFHTYGVEWSPGYIAWYIDGQIVSELYNSNVDYEELYIIANLAMGGNWTNYGTDSGGLGRPSGERYPADYDLTSENFTNPALEIDFIRVYRRR